MAKLFSSCSCFKMQCNRTTLSESHGPLGLLWTPSTSCRIVSLMPAPDIYGVPTLCWALCGAAFRKLPKLLALFIRECPPLYTRSQEAAIWNENNSWEECKIKLGN